MKAIIDTEWLDQQIEKYDSLLKVAHDDNDYNGYNELSAAQSTFKRVKAQLSPIKEHIEDAFNAGYKYRDSLGDRGSFQSEYEADDINDYLKQNGYE